MQDTPVGEAHDRWLATAMAAAGGAVIALALHQGWRSQEMNPGIEGALTAGLFGPILALLGGLRFSAMLKVAVPIWIIQLVVCASVAGPVLAVLGLQMVTVGVFGTIQALDPWGALARWLYASRAHGEGRESSAAIPDADRGAFQAIRRQQQSR